MVVQFVKKYVVEVVPSIIATVVGAYIVTHYINVKPDADKAKTEAVKTEAASPAKINLPVAAEKMPAEKTAVDKQAADKNEKASETASVPAESRKPQSATKESQKNKTAKATPMPPPTSAAALAHEAEDNRDANEIARAAIERLRSADGKETAKEIAKPAEAPRVQEAARTSEPARSVQERSRLDVVYTPPSVQPSTAIQPAGVQSVAAPAITPLPSVSIAPSPSDNAPAAHGTSSSPFANHARAEDRSRPTPPADIPSRPLDLRAAPQDHTSVAEDVVSAAKSVFKAVVPQ